MREGRNEPSNLPYIARALSSSYGLSEADMFQQLRANAFEFFGIAVKSKEEIAAAEAEKHAMASAAASKGEHEIMRQSLQHSNQSHESDDGVEERGDDERGNAFTAIQDDESEDASGAEQESVGGERPEHGVQIARRRNLPDELPSKKPAARSFLVSQVPPVFGDLLHSFIQNKSCPGLWGGGLRSYHVCLPGMPEHLVQGA